MPRSEYVINRGVNAPIEFRGLRGQYIYYLGIGLTAVLVLFVVLYLCGVPALICVSIAGISGGYLFRRVYHDNAKFGVDGLMKKKARKILPAAIKNQSRIIFFSNQQLDGEGT